MMLILIVVIFIVCHSIRCVVNMYECIQAFYPDPDLPAGFLPTWAGYLMHLSHLALVFNSSSNILIYCCKASVFSMCNYSVKSKYYLKC